MWLVCLAVVQQSKMVRHFRQALKLSRSNYKRVVLFVWKPFKFYVLCLNMTLTSLKFLYATRTDKRSYFLHNISTIKSINIILCIVLIYSCSVYSNRSERKQRRLFDVEYKWFLPKNILLRKWHHTVVSSRKSSFIIMMRLLRLAICYLINPSHSWQPNNLKNNEFHNNFKKHM